MSYYNQPFSSSLPPPPMEAPPKPPRRVSTIMSPGTFKMSDDVRPPIMKRLNRVLSTRRMSNSSDNSEGTGPSLGYHLDAFAGKAGIISKAISRDNGVVNQPFSYSTTSILTKEEESNEFYIPPPPLPKLVRLTLKKPLEIMTLDQRWLLQHSFAESTLLHYACAGDQYEVVKLLLERGADWNLVNASNKTADMYSGDDRIRELFNSADTKYTPYTGPAKPQITASTPSPVTASPPSILKTANSGRRRQSIINDSSWADNNLRSTVHQSQVLNIRSPSSNNTSVTMNVNSSANNSPLNSTLSRRPTLSAKSGPDWEANDYEEPDAPATNVVPMNFNSSQHTLTRTESATGSVYSNAEVVTTLSDIDDAGSVMSFGTEGTAASHTNSGRKRLSFRRGSRIVQALREKEAVSTPTSIPASEVVSSPAPSAASRKSAKNLRARDDADVSVTASVALSTSTSIGLSARPLPTVPTPPPPPLPVSSVVSTPAVHRVPPPPPPVEKKSTDEGNANLGAARKSFKGKRTSATKLDTNTDTESTAGSKPVLIRHPPPPPRAAGEATAVSNPMNSEDTVNSVASAAKRKSTKRMKEETKAQSAPAPPIRVMRRLSMNMSMGAVEAASYIEDASGEQILSTSVLLRTDNTEKNEPNHVSEEAKTGPAGLSSSDTTEKNAAVSQSKAVSEAAAKFTAELGDESLLEAWEIKTTKKYSAPPTESPLVKLQSAMKTGGSEGLAEAAELIARAELMEKAEARDAKLNQTKADRLQQLLSKLTPLENIASGVLLKGRSAEEVSREYMLDQDDHDHEQQKEEGLETLTGSSAGVGVAGSKEFAFAFEDNLRGNSSSPEKKTSHHPTLVPPQSEGRGVSPVREAFHSLSFRDMIWRRAAHHLNSAMSDKQRSHYDKARLDAYQLGVRLMKKEFSTMAYKDRWEAIDMMEESRLLASEREMRNNPHSWMQHNQSTPAPFVPPMDHREISFVEQATTRHSSFVPFSRNSMVGLFNDDDSE